MSLNRAVVSVAAIFLGVSAAVAQQPETAPAVSASTLTNPPVFQGLMVDAKGKTVGRLFIPVPPNYCSQRQQLRRAPNKQDLGAAAGF
jgi:hypothetical protein